MTNELLQVFPIPVHITKYEENMEKEFKFIKNIFQHIFSQIETVF